MIGAHQTATINDVLLALITLASVIIAALLKRESRKNMISRPNVHRRSRRTLTKGAVPPFQAIGVEATPSGSTVSLGFSSAVVVTGTIPLTVESRTFVSQEIVSPTLAILTMSGAVTGMDYTLAGNPATVRGLNGGVVSGVAGTFP